jgi:hypothetical protein
MQQQLYLTADELTTCSVHASGITIHRHFEFLEYR